MQSGYFQKIMIFGILVFGLSFGLVLNLTTPKSVLSLVWFFVSLFLFSLCLSSFIFYSTKRKVTNNELIYTSISSSFRQGLFIAIFADAILALAALRLLTWWDGILLGISLLLLEIYFKSERRVTNG